MSHARAVNAAASAEASDERRARKRANEAEKKRKKDEEVAVKCVRLRGRPWTILGAPTEMSQGIAAQTGSKVPDLFTKAACSRAATRPAPRVPVALRWPPCVPRSTAPYTATHRQLDLWI